MFGRSSQDRKLPSVEHCAKRQRLDDNDVFQTVHLQKLNDDDKSAIDTEVQLVRQDVESLLVRQELSAIELRNIKQKYASLRSFFEELWQGVLSDDNILSDDAMNVFSKFKAYQREFSLKSQMKVHDIEREIRVLISNFGYIGKNCFIMGTKKKNHFNQKHEPSRNKSMEISWLKNKSDCDAVTHVTISGYLSKMKRNQRMLTPVWNNRWFALDGHELKYYQSKRASKPSATIDLMDIESVRSFERNDHGMFSFVIKTAARSYFLRAESEGDMRRWVRGLREQKELWLDKRSPKKTSQVLNRKPKHYREDHIIHSKLETSLSLKAEQSNENCGTGVATGSDDDSEEDGWSNQKVKKHTVKTRMPNTKWAVSQNDEESDHLCGGDDDIFSPGGLPAKATVWEEETEVISIKKSSKKQIR